MCEIHSVSSNCGLPVFVQFAGSCHLMDSVFCLARGSYRSLTQSRKEVKKELCVFASLCEIHSVPSNCGPPIFVQSARSCHLMDCVFCLARESYRSLTQSRQVAKRSRRNFASLREIPSGRPTVVRHFHSLSIVRKISVGSLRGFD